MSGGCPARPPPPRPRCGPEEGSLPLALEVPLQMRGEAQIISKNALTVHDVVPFFFLMYSPGKGKRKKNAGVSVRCHFRTRNSILGESKGVIL